ncbi:MAG: DUF1800 domain-containing protein [Beijerinckiaceae bacterium]
MALSQTDAKRAVLALHRFGLGAKPGAMATDVVKDPVGALRRETYDPQKLFIDNDTLMTTQAALAAHFQEARAVNQARNASRDDTREMRVATARVGASAPPPNAMGMMDSGMMAAPPATAPNRPANAQQPPQIEQVIYRNEALARMAKGVEPPIGFGERLVLFWSNHFCVSVAKGQITRATAGALEREAIRPHAFGKFSDMLLAVEKHPAMLYYLDNRQSVGPNSRAGKNRSVGLNENLAREILELHTLGVNGGYTQVDVTSLAKIITGWTFVGQGERLGPAGTFVFTANRHEPGEQTVLGKSYKDTGVEQGEMALRDIARHPATANHIATKLAKHFVADEPPASLVAQLAKVFRDTDGDLAEVSRALVSHPEAFKGELTKIRTPYEWLVSIARFAGVPKEFGQVLGPLNALGAPLWAVPGPNGYPDTFAHWGSPESMRARLDLAATIGRRLGGNFNPSELAEQLFDSALSSETAQAIRRAESKQQGMAILMMSPEFQRR